MHSLVLIWRLRACEQFLLRRNDTELAALDRTQTGTGREDLPRSLELE